MKQTKIWNYLAVFFFGLLLVSGTVVVAASSAKQLAKGISLYNQNKDTQAMDYFIDVLVNGNADEVAEANRYIDLIHNRVGGIQTPVEVDVNFKEGEVKVLDEKAQAAVLQAQQAAEEQAAQLKAAQEAAAAQAEAEKQKALEEVQAQQQALSEQIEAKKMQAAQQAEQYKEAAQAAQDNLAADWEMATATTGQELDNLAEQATQAEQAVEDAAVAAAVQSPVLAQTEPELAATQQEDWEAVADQTTAQLNASRNDMLTTVNGTSAFTDLTSPQAIEARELYTAQKIDSMKQAAIQNINDTENVHLYMRDGRPDALEIAPEVIFDKGDFRADSQPLLNSIYELLALTQGAEYVILPAGSYTDDVTLPGIRQAMALNSYLINRGISQGKLHYNMGLVDEEPPARFANLNGLSIVFDYDAKLPTVLEKNANNETAPLLSMAIVPLCHAIDRSLGEAFAIDFSVLETVNPLDNWTLQIIQHGSDGKYYIVRQLEGFSPVYHQILFNGRKGVIGPELPCGKYTLVLTGTDLKGKKQTLRRRVVVKCAEAQNTCDGTCSVKQTAAAKKELNYKTARLWTKPRRTMYADVVAPAKSEAKAVSTATDTRTKTVRTTTIVEEDNGAEPVTTTTTVQTGPVAPAYPPAADVLPTNNPYDMPYDVYND